LDRDSGAAQGGRIIAKNFAYLLAAQVVAGVAGLISMAYLARTLGPETFGILGFGVAIIAYFGHFVVLGSDFYGAREIARQPETAGPLISQIVNLRLITAAAAVITFLLVVWVIDQSHTVKTVLVIQGVGLVVTIIAIDFMFQGLQRMAPMAIRQVGASLLVLVAVVVLVEGPNDIYLAAAIPVAATGLSAIWLLIQARKIVGPIGIGGGFGANASLLRAILPLAVSGTMSTIYYNTDIVMLGFMSDHHAVGLYVGAYRLFIVSLTIGNLIGAVYAPALAASWRDDRRRHSDFQEFSGAMFLIGMPVAAAGIAFPRELIALVFGADFEAAQGAFVILMAAVAFAHIAATGGVCLIAWNDQTVHMVVLSLGAVANIIANLALIPVLGIVGAASATLACQGVVAIVILVRIHRRHAKVDMARLVRPVLCAAAAFAIARVMFELLVGFRPDGSGLFGAIACMVSGGVIYIGLANAFGAVDLGGLRKMILDRATGGGR